MQFKKSEEHSVEEDADYKIHCIEVFYYVFAELRSKKVPIPVNEIIKTMRYLTIELKKFIEEVDLELAEDDYAKRLDYILVNFRDYVEVDLEKKHIAITKKSLMNLDDAWFFVEDLLQKAALDMVLNQLKISESGNMHRAALRRAVSVRFPYTASKVLSRTTVFEDMASKTKMLLVIGDTVVLKGCNKMDIQNKRLHVSSSDSLRKRSMSYSDLGESHYASENRPPKQRQSFTPSRQDKSKGQLRSNCGNKSSSVNSSPPLVGLRPVGVPPYAPTNSSNLSIANGLRKPSAEGFSDQTAFGLRKPMREKTPEPKLITKVLNHGRRCICDKDLKKVFQDAGEATFDELASQNLRCLIFLVKRYVLELDCHAPSCKDEGQEKQPEDPMDIMD